MNKITSTIVATATAALVLAGAGVMLTAGAGAGSGIGATTTPETTFAQVDSNGNVLTVIVATRSFIDSGAVGNPSGWVETSATSSNYAGKGMKYTAGAFATPAAMQPNNAGAIMSAIQLQASSSARL